ncbi:MAG: hypothetical protein DI526_14730 [Caulobacter segnis]|uniref:Uncharacterized protein n=2 Tax=Caulobacter segnis TaxID=88688 RepID=A0A2W5X7Y6_9CAUL|nr:MAG: hypothetical protein DI526_14730 [Caulobacter segnis]
MSRALLASVLCLVLSSTAPAFARDAEPAPDNAAMTEIFNADQAIRQGFTVGQKPDRAFVERMTAEDAARRLKVRALLEAGALKTGEDFRKAAFVFQHGLRPDDFLMAHSLAIAAAARGSQQAAWIAAASLDRYLQMTGGAQIYGTQTTVRQGEAPTLDPYNRDLIPDALRSALGVPALAEQQAKLESVQSAMKAARPGTPTP